jgi:hypothetical protein
MSTLQKFLNEIVADHKIGPAVISDVAYATAFSDMERFFSHLENRTEPVALELHDAVVRIVTRDSPLRERLLAAHEATNAALPQIKALDPRSRAQ